MRLMMVLSTSASSGLMTSSRSASVLDGAICSRGTSSPVAGSRYWTRLWWDSSVSSPGPDAGGAQDFDGRPGPERAVLFDGEVAPFAGGQVFGPDDGGAAGGGAGQGLPGGGEDVAGAGIAGCVQQRGRAGVLLGGAAD